MFTNITIKNFRCFTAIQFAKLGRVNLIAGKNNSGKTAVLEAIHIHNRPSDIAQAISVAQFRGIVDPFKDISEWASWLFLGKAGQGGFEVSSCDEQGITRQLTAWLLDSIATRQRFPNAERELQMSFRSDMLASPLRLVFQFEQNNEPAQISIATLASNSFSLIGARINWDHASTFIASSPGSTDQDIRHFGDIERSKRQEELLPSLRFVEPRLKRLALIPIGGIPVIHGDVGLPQMVPVHLMGEGLRRLQSLLLAIVNSKGGVVLIDEIENGLHHSILPSIWKAIAVAARMNNVQVFATTHSYECIQAAHAAFVESGHYDLNLYRLERSDSNIIAVDYDQTTLDTSVDMQLEVR